MAAATRLLSRVAAAGAVTVVIAACGGSGSSSSASSSPSGTSSSAASASSVDASASWVTTTPVAKGPLASVSWDLPFGEPTSLDPVYAAAYSQNTVLANVCQGLLEVAPNTQIEPSLAASYDTPTPTTWIYHLRPGVRFSDGHLMTPADVVYSLERNMNAKLGSFWSPWYASVKSIAPMGADAIKVILSQPDPTFNEFLATAGGVVSEKAYVEKAGKNYGTAKGGLMCTGPYVIKQWTPGSQIVTTVNPHYWDTAQQPKVAQVVYKFITNPSTLADALNSGEIDGAYETPISDVPTLEHSSAGKLYIGKSTEYVNAAYTTRPGPIQDLKVREALGIMLDRQAIAKTVFHGTAAPINALDFPSTWGYGASVYEQAYADGPDLSQPQMAKAKALLAGAGKLRPISVMLNADDTAAVQLGLYYQSVAGQLGIKVKLVELPAAQEIAEAFSPKTQRQYDVILSDSGYFDVGEPLEQALYSLQAGQPFNTFGYDNPTVNRLIASARRTLNDDARARLVSRAWTIADADWTQAPIVNYGERLFMNKRITGAPAALPTYLYYPWAASLGATN